MNNTEILLYLLKGLEKNEYEAKIFCDEYVDAFKNLKANEMRNSELQLQLEDLLEMAARFSDYEEDLKLKNVYFNEDEIKKKVHEILALI